MSIKQILIMIFSKFSIFGPLEEKDQIAQKAKFVKLDSTREEQQNAINWEAFEIDISNLLSMIIEEASPNLIHDFAKNIAEKHKVNYRLITKKLVPSLLDCLSITDLQTKRLKQLIEQMGTCELTQHLDHIVFLQEQTAILIRNLNYLIDQKGQIEIVGALSECIKLLNTVKDISLSLEIRNPEILSVLGVVNNEADRLIGLLHACITTTVY